MDFSIIIPTYNRPDSLKECLDSISQLAYQKEKFEVIIVDDGSTESMNSIVNIFEKELNIHCLRQNNTGPAMARNNGAEIAKGKYLVFTDDDCQMDNNYLTNLERNIKNYPSVVFTGKTINQLTQNKYAAASQLLTDFLYSFFSDQNQQTSFLVSNNFAISKQVFQHVGSFNNQFKRAASEDRELGERLIYEGYKIQYQQNLMIEHAHHLSFQQFLKQHFTYGRGSVLYRQISKEYKAIQQSFSPFSFYTKLLLYPFSKGINITTINATLLLMTSQIAYIFGHFFEKFNWK